MQDRIITLAFQEHPTLMEYMQQENIDCPASSLQWIAGSFQSFLSVGIRISQIALSAENTDIFGLCGFFLPLHFV